MLRRALRPLKEHFSVYLTDMNLGEVMHIRSGIGSYYADPFIWTTPDGTWLLVEKYDYAAEVGCLCAIRVDRGGRPSLEVGLPFAGHISFPFLFEDSGKLYMVPETCSERSVDLYECESFPAQWKYRSRILSGVDAADTVVFRHEGRWWLITSVRDNPGEQRYLAIYSSQGLDGEWRAHPVNRERRYSDGKFGYGRNGGSIVYFNRQLLRMMQASELYYGQSLVVMEIKKLTLSEYAETEFEGSHPVKEISRRNSPHHISMHRGLIAFDIRDRINFLQHVQSLKRRTGLEANPVQAC